MRLIYCRNLWCPFSHEKSCAILELLIMCNGLGISCRSIISHLHNFATTVNKCILTDNSAYSKLTLASSIRGPPPDWTVSTVPSHITLSYVMHEHTLGMPWEGTLETSIMWQLPNGGSKKMFGKSWILCKCSHIHKIMKSYWFYSDKKFLIHCT